MDAAEDDVLAFMAFPKEHWPQIASTNPLERVNKEIKRRSHVVGIFPNDQAIMRLVGALMAEQTEEWHITRRYMSQESLARVLNNDPPPSHPRRRGRLTTSIGDPSYTTCRDAAHWHIMIKRVS